MRKLVNYRLHPEVIDGLNEAAQAAGVSRTVWVERAICDALGIEAPGEDERRRARSDGIAKRERDAKRRRARQESKNEWKRRRKDEIEARTGRRRPDSLKLREPTPDEARAVYVERRVRELKRTVPSEAAARVLATREWNEGRRG